MSALVGVLLKNLPISVNIFIIIEISKLLSREKNNAIFIEAEQRG